MRRHYGIITFILVIGVCYFLSINIQDNYIIIHKNNRDLSVSFSNYEKLINNKIKKGTATADDITLLNIVKKLKEPSHYYIGKPFFSQTIRSSLTQFIDTLNKPIYLHSSNSYIVSSIIEQRGSLINDKIKGDLHLLINDIENISSDSTSLRFFYFLDFKYKLQNSQFYRNDTVVGLNSLECYPGSIKSLKIKSCNPNSKEKYQHR